jgi:hypothetical protein
METRFLINILRCYNFLIVSRNVNNFLNIILLEKYISKKIIVFLKNVRNLFLNVCNIGKCTRNYPYALFYEEKETG